MSTKQREFNKMVRRRVLGIAYIIGVIGLISLSIAGYNKTFVDVVKVSLETDHTGNQLIKGSDVKIRGLIVGEVREISADGDGAKLILALQPGKTELIPSNVSAQLLPKTLFGERYVALIPPADEARPIEAGDTIAQDRSRAAIEMAEVLNNLMPLLQAVKPAELSATLNALATALNGRGEQLGNNLVTLNAYLRQLNPAVPQLVDDLDKLGRLALELDGVAPELFSMLDNLATTSQTIVEKRVGLHNLLVSGKGTVDVLSSFLEANEDRLIRVAAQNAQVVGLLEEYSPVYGCFFKQMSKLDKLGNAAITKRGIKLSIEVVRHRGSYVAGDRFDFDNVTRVGPQCWGLPNPPVPFPVFEINDGASQVGGAGSGSMQTVDRSGYSQQGVGTAAEQSLIATIISGPMETTPESVPSVATLLAGPLLRGNQVVMR